MKKTLILLLLSCCLLNVGAQTLIPTSGDASKQLSLNGTWDFYFDNATEPASIKVPGNWDMQGFAEPVYGDHKSMFTKERPSHNGTYRRTFTLPPSWRGQQVWIAFDGVENGYSLFVNGDSIGAFHSAFNRAMFDISRAVKFGRDNEITVKVTQTGVPYWEFDTNDDWAFGGISRDVTLYAIPEKYISDLAVSYAIDGGDATVSLKMATTLKRHSWHVSLTDADGNTIYNNAFVKSDTFSFPVREAHLWSAETPYLYTLRVALVEGKNVRQAVSKKVGIRTVSWQDGVFRINGVAVKLKGINHHDESPVNGRAITEAEMLHDLRMMKAADINTIRCSHYPPSPHFMDMLDSLGFYAICEVPFGFGDRYLGRVSTLPELKKRAWYTVQRDKNRPSVVIWSVGNENPITDNGLKTAHYVLRLDPTRPNVFPNTHKPFLKELTLDDDSITMYSCHYPLRSELHKWPSELKHPLVNTECAHALGLDFGQIEGLVDEWFAHDRLAGGCVWAWADQGLLRHDRHISSRYEPTEEVWLNPTTYYDMKGILGTDGIVYPDRFPQTDYYEIRAAYSPVVITADTTGAYTITNRYDFTNLNALTCKVDYFKRAQLQRTFTTHCDVAPHKTVPFGLLDNLPRDLYGYATVTFSSSNGDELYKQSFRLDSTFIEQVERGEAEYLNPDSMSLAKATTLSVDSVTSWVSRHILLRMGRKPTLSSEATLSGEQGKKHGLWGNYVTRPDYVNHTATKNGKEIYGFDGPVYEYRLGFHSDSAHTAKVMLQIGQRDNGVWHVYWELAADGPGEALETGITIKTDMKSADTDFRWLGCGPYASYPGRSMLSWYGCHHLQGDDIYFPGNRMNVTAAMLYDNSGKALTIVPCGWSSGNVCVERDSDGTINLSYNAVPIASPFNKNIWPEGTVSTQSLLVDGEFDMVVTDGQLSPYLRSFLVGNTKDEPVHKPYYNSYDQ